MQHYLVLTAIGSDRTGIVTELTDAIQALKCSVDDSRMAILGGEFSIIMMTSGAADGIAAFKNSLKALEAKTGLTITAKETLPTVVNDNIQLVAVETIATDEPGIAHRVTQFFAEKNINIDTLATDRYPAPHTGAPMFELDMGVQVPSNISISELQEAFQSFCDELDIEGSLEPM